MRDIREALKGVSLLLFGKPKRSAIWSFVLRRQREQQIVSPTLFAVSLSATCLRQTSFWR